MKKIIAIVLLNMFFVSANAELWWEITRSSDLESILSTLNIESNNDILSENDRNFYETIKNRIDLNDKKNVENTLKNYKRSLSNYSLSKQKSINERLVWILEDEIFNIIISHPQDIALPDNAYRNYLILSLFKFEIILLDN